MTYRDLYKTIIWLLRQSGCDSPQFDAGCLFSQIAEISRGTLALCGNETVPDDIYIKLCKAAKERASGRPLQYILGSWDFLSLTLEVGEGVLIPRPETELLCEKAADELAEINNPQILDLCAGSGCVGLGIASLCPSVQVTAIELSDAALRYLRRNCLHYPKLKVKPIKADVLHDSDIFKDKYDAIISNPPYIPSQDLPNLMREVQHEPSMALDGGDGLIFYRAIANYWIPKLSNGGICAVEAGIGQAKLIAEIFINSGLSNVKIYKDLSGIDRVIIGKNS